MRNSHQLFGHEEKPEHLVTTGKICVKMDERMQGEKILERLFLWHRGVPAHQMIYAAGDNGLWKLMIAHGSSVAFDDDNDVDCDCQWYR